MSITGIRLLAGALALASAPVSAATVGQPAPPFTITTFDKEKVTLDQVRGEVVVLNYWATWCGPCKAEMPMMNVMHIRHKNKGFEIYAVTTEGSVPQYKLQKVKEVLSFQLASKLKGKYGTISNSVPTSYVIDRKGIVRYAKAGAFDESKFSALILPLLAEPAS